MQEEALVRKVADFWRRLGDPTGALVAAVSGGADSVALLRVLLHVRPASASAPLVVAHLNHQLRGPDSDADEAFVCDLCRQLSVEFRSQRVDVASVARDGGENLEKAARRLRYDWLTKIAREAGAGWLATGHTADDQAETVLHRLLRGAGFKGLRGIAGRRSLLPGIDLVRPLLAVRRVEVLSFLESIGQSYRQDESNFDLKFTRNRIRLELLPLLREGYNQAVVEVLGRLAAQAEEAFREDEERATALLAEAERSPAGKTLIFDRQTLLSGRRRIVREALRLLWDREGWPTDGMGFDDWDRAAAVVFGDIPALDLPGNIHVRGLERVLQIGRTGS